jgi:predicted nucleic acid-binding protein
MMCIVLDTCAFSPVFNSTDKRHKEYMPVLNWVVCGKGKLVYGGKQYKDELRRSPKYFKLFANLERAGKLVQLCDKNVDEWQKMVRDIEPNKDFDDPHLIAIILESKCKLICTDDKRAIPYLTDLRFYINNVKRPKIYKSSKNTSLLNDRYIADICKPCKNLSKQEAAGLIAP